MSLFDLRGVHELHISADGLVVADGNQADLLDVPLENLFDSTEYILPLRDRRSLDDLPGELPCRVADLAAPVTEEDPLDWTHHDELYDDLTDELVDTPEPTAPRPGYADRMERVSRVGDKRHKRPVTARARKALARRP